MQLSNISEIEDFIVEHVQMPLANVRSAIKEIRTQRIDLGSDTLCDHLDKINRALWDVELATDMARSRLFPPKLSQFRAKGLDAAVSIVQDVCA